MSIIYHTVHFFPFLYFVHLAIIILVPITDRALEHNKLLSLLARSDNHQKNNKNMTTSIISDEDLEKWCVTFLVLVE